MEMKIKIDLFLYLIKCRLINVIERMYMYLHITHTCRSLDDDDFCYKRVQTPGMSPPRAGAWTYCLFTPRSLVKV